MGVINTTSGVVELTVCHPGGSVRLRAPDDVPLAELMCDFLECTGHADGDWILSGEDEGEYPAGRTLAQLGVRDGARLRLTDRNPAVGESPAGDPAVEPGAATAPVVGVEEQTGRVTLIGKPAVGESAAGKRDTGGWCRGPRREAGRAREETVAGGAGDACASRRGRLRR